MKNVIYFKPSDQTKFDFKRYEKSLQNYADVPTASIKAALKELDTFENLHVSRLVEAGVALIEKYGDTKAAKQYYDDHSQYFGAKFERIRRITGYLAGTLERWNDAKRAEESARVKHSVNSCINDEARAARLQEQALAHNVAYANAAAASH